VKFSEAVQVSRDGDRLVAPVPAKVAAELALEDGDVLCWTAQDDGTIEVWRVARNPYETLDTRRDR
jgi:antitoxin component of MazEF toxin-antitoxin module